MSNFYELTMMLSHKPELNALKHALKFFRSMAILELSKLLRISKIIADGVKSKGDLHCCRYYSLPG